MPNNFEEGIIKIIMEGGDADTNAAVAGSLLGCKFGFDSIPKTLIDNLYQGNYLESKVTSMIKSMKDYESVKLTLSK